MCMGVPTTGVQSCLDNIICSQLYRSLYKDWLGCYETLADMVVPRSSKLLQEDNEFGLYSVTVFKKVVDEYKLHAREKRSVME